LDGVILRAFIEFFNPRKPHHFRTLAPRLRIPASDKPLLLHATGEAVSWERNAYVAPIEPYKNFESQYLDLVVEIIMQSQIGEFNSSKPTGESSGSLPGF